MKKSILTCTFIIAAFLSFAQGKIAVVDTQKLIDSVPQKKQVVAEIGHMTETAEKEINDMKASIQKMVEEYKTNEATWSESIKQFEQQRIESKQKEMQQYIREADDRINNYSMIKQQELFLIVKAAVQLVAEKKGYEVVLEVNNTVYSKAPNLTNEVAALLTKKQGEVKK